MRFPFMEVVSNKEGFSLYGKCVDVTSPIQIHNFLQKSFLPMAAAMCQVLYSFYSDYSKKSPFISFSNEFYQKYLVTNDYCVSTHNSLCFLENCKFHLFLIGTCFCQILRRLDNCIYMYQEINCLYSFFKHRFHTSMVTSGGEVFNQLN